MPAVTCDVANQPSTNCRSNCNEKPAVIGAAATIGMTIGRE